MDIPLKAYPAVLDGRHVHLRPIERADIERGWLDWINNPSVQAGLATKGAQTREMLEDYLAKSAWPAAAMFAICLRDSGRYVGNMRLSALDWTHRTCTYGYLLEPGAQGKGYGSEALFLVCRYALHDLGMNRVSTGVSDFNTASVKSNEKAGFRREGIQRERIFHQGKFHDAVALALLRSDFDALYPTASIEEYWRRQGR